MTRFAARDLRLTYQGANAAVLGPFDCTVQPGDRVGLAGESGSGKTTILELAAGLRIPGLRITSGSLTWTGNPVVAYIPQESSNSLSPFLTAMDHVRGICRDRERAAHILDHLGLSGRRESHPCRLSGGERQRVLVAMALAASPDFILADEPTANLDSGNTALVCEALTRTRAAILVASHRDEIFERLGCTTVHRLTRKADGSPPPLAAHGTDAVLDIRGLDFAYIRRDFWMRAHPAGFALRDISLLIRAGELVTLSGPSGSGKSTLARCLAERSRNTQLVEQEPSNTLNPNQRLTEAIREANPRVDAGAALAEVGLPAAWTSRRASELSEGQRARVAIARALAACPDHGLLILDESLSGLDESSERGILEAIQAAQQRRKLGCLVIAHEPRFAAHRAIRMEGGHLFGA